MVVGCVSGRGRVSPAAHGILTAAGRDLRLLECRLMDVLKLMRLCDGVCRHRLRHEAPYPLKVYEESTP